ncbi:MAG: inositol monophosphatase family protein [Anaerolineales bacterium]|jgi:myo-inositol-1(or 4)-monophosphatase|nr:inositol monophosphatase family protein [Anaerolineales bacterium]
MNLSPLLSFASDLAYRAGRITLGYFNTGIRPDYKPDDSPVTAADRAAEEFIRAEIEKHYPTHAILGEEFGRTPPGPLRDSTRESVQWIIDPIDGTKSFLRGVPLYGVLIGLEIDGIIKVGAAYFPATDEMLSAAEGLGAWWNGRRARVSEVSSLERAYICYTSERNMARQNRAAAWQRINAAAYASRGWSDAYGYLCVATGRAEAMLDPIMNIWDCGPFPVIFTEAGGYFGSWDGRPGHTHAEALACNAALKDEILQLING